MTKAELTKQATEKLDKLIGLKEQQIALLTELRDMIAIAEAFGVDAEQIESAGFKSPTSGEHAKWSKEARYRLPRYVSGRSNASEYRGTGVVNRVRLRGGRELTRIEPVFLSAGPEVPMAYYLDLAKDELRAEGRHISNFSYAREDNRQMVRDRAEEIKERMNDART